MQSMGRRRAGFGLTLIELMVTLTIGAILLALAVPQMREYIARTRVSGIATELAADIRLARSMVQQQNQPIWISFGRANDFDCYVLYTAGGQTGICDCTRTSMCDAFPDPPIALRSVFIKQNTGITLISTSTDLYYKQPVGAPVTSPPGSSAEAVVDGGSLGGRVKLIMSGFTKATLCSLAGHTAEFGNCP